MALDPADFSVITKPYSLVWFKRDLRCVDHRALQVAASRGPVLCLYIIEPSLWRAPDAAQQHYHFILESLRELQAALRQLGGRLHVVSGEVTEVLTRLFALAPFAALYSHEETGNAVSYRRDLAVARWCRERAVDWHEYPQFGVVRRLKSRDAWQAHWAAHVSQPILPLPELHPVPLPWQAPPPPTAQQLGLAPHDPPNRQHGGRRLGQSILSSFLVDRSWPARPTARKCVWISECEW